jgi:hypothetical protein
MASFLPTVATILINQPTTRHQLSPGLAQTPYFLTRHRVVNYITYTETVALSNLMRRGELWILVDRMAETGRSK